jgi:hypothetical protein
VHSGQPGQAAVGQCERDSVCCQSFYPQLLTILPYMLRTFACILADAALGEIPTPRLRSACSIDASAQCVNEATNVSCRVSAYGSSVLIPRFEQVPMHKHGPERPDLATPVPFLVEIFRGADDFVSSLRIPKLRRELHANKSYPPSTRLYDSGL